MKSLLGICMLVMACTASGMAQATSTLHLHPELVRELNPKMAPFYHGVASGDPTQHAVILWTRITLERSVREAWVHWELATDRDFEQVVSRGKVHTGPEKGFTVKTDATGLTAGTTYYYRFQHGSTYSMVGQTQTLPADPNSFHMAFASCSNYEWGYFNAYRHLAADTAIDLVVHLGDYIYETPQGGYGDTSIGRKHWPSNELVQLEDYRTRYSQYRLDPDLQLAHQMKPFITTWDDHELANNSYVEGAASHQPDQEGDWNVRREMARQAYNEWLPIRDHGQQVHYRSFQIGSLFNLMMLDTRLAGRTEQVANEQDPQYWDADRSILGPQQNAWLRDHLRTEVSWRIIGNQVPFGPMYITWGEPGDRYMDGWDGYPAERKGLIDFLRTNGLKNVVFITGDTHRSFALGNDLNGTATTDDDVAAEFIITSINSGNDDERYGPEKVKAVYDQFFKYNQHLRYLNNHGHGYAVLTITPEELRTDYYYVSTVKTNKATLSSEGPIRLKSGSPVLLMD